MDSPSRHFSPSAALPNLAPPPSRHRVSFPGKAGIFSSSEILDHMQTLFLNKLYFKSSLQYWFKKFIEIYCIQDNTIYSNKEVYFFLILFTDTLYFLWIVYNSWGVASLEIGKLAIWLAKYKSQRDPRTYNGSCPIILLYNTCTPIME